MRLLSQIPKKQSGIPKELYPCYGIAAPLHGSVLCNVKLNIDGLHFDEATENTVVERPCILLQLYGGDAKKKKCCKNYKKDKACKKCPRD